MWPIASRGPCRKPNRIGRAAAFAAYAVAILAPGSAHAQARLGTLNGTWQGTLTVVSATAATPDAFWHAGDRPEFSLAIDGEVATVRVNSGEWRELRIGDGFHVFKLESSAYVYALHRANGWVENWMLSVTKKDPRTMLVFLSYVAGGSLERLDEVTGEFAVGAMGELTRADEAAGPE